MATGVWHGSVSRNPTVCCEMNSASTMSTVPLPFTSPQTGHTGHDGVPVVAADVVFTIGLVQDPDYQGLPALVPLWREVAATAVFAMRVSCLVPQERLEEAVRLLHAALIEEAG